MQVQAQIKVDAYAVAAGAGLGRRKNPPGWQQQAGGDFGLAGHGPPKSRDPIGSLGTNPCSYLKSGSYLGTFSGILDWSSFLQQFDIWQRQCPVEGGRSICCLPSHSSMHAKIQEVREVQLHPRRLSPASSSTSAPPSTTLILSPPNHSSLSRLIGLVDIPFYVFSPWNHRIFSPKIGCDRQRKSSSARHLSLSSAVALIALARFSACSFCLA